MLNIVIKTLYWNDMTVVEVVWLSPNHVLVCLQTATSRSSGSVIPASHKNTCSQCGKNFSGIYFLHVHEAAHKGNYPYWCEICGKGCLSTSNLRRHVAAHAGVHDYKCTWCMQEFTCSWNLKRHVRHFHQDITE